MKASAPIQLTIETLPELQQAANQAWAAYEYGVAIGYYSQTLTLLHGQSNAPDIKDGWHYPLRKRGGAGDTIY